MISNEMESLKTKMRTASNITDTIQNYFITRKRSLWLWAEDRSLLSKLGHIFRSNLRKAYSCGDLNSKQQEALCSCSTRGKLNVHDQDKASEGANDGIHRYYHVFEKGELARLIRNNAKDLHICHEWLEQGNWVIIAEKI